MVKPAGILLAAALPLLPGVGAADRREPIEPARAPWTALVRVQTELGERCTGFMVAPQVAVTAAHCLYLPKVGGFIRPDSVHVLLGYRFGRYAGHARVVRFTVPDAYRPGDEAATAGADRAVLVLDRRLLPASEALAVSPVPTLPAAVLLGGYGQDRDEVVVAEPGCRVLGERPDGEGRPLLVHDCEATRGTSGAPLLWRRPDGLWAAIGIQVAAEAMSGGVAVPLQEPGAATAAGRSADR